MIIIMIIIKAKKKNFAKSEHSPEPRRLCSIMAPTFVKIMKLLAVTFEHIIVTFVGTFIKNRIIL